VFRVNRSIRERTYKYSQCLRGLSLHHRHPSKMHSMTSSHQMNESYIPLGESWDLYTIRNSMNQIENKFNINNQSYLAHFSSISLLLPTLLCSQCPPFSHTLISISFPRTASQTSKRKKPRIKALHHRQYQLINALHHRQYGENL